MKAAMLAAGVGSRLGHDVASGPKALLRFQGETLLKRHLDILDHFGVDDLTITVGYQAEAIDREIARLGASNWVHTVRNPHYRESSLLSLWALREVFAAGEPVLYMDADVLYDHRLLDRLLSSPHPDCLLIDRNTEPGDDPLKVPILAGRIVDFHKIIGAPDYDYWAEWVGFARFSAETADNLVPAIEAYVRSGRVDVIYEEPIRDLILQAGGAGFGFEDITGLPWIEIDFPEDLLVARDHILPRLESLPNVRQHRR